MAASDILTKHTFPVIVNTTTHHSSFFHDVWVVVCLVVLVSWCMGCGLLCWAGSMMYGLWFALLCWSHDVWVVVCLVELAPWCMGCGLPCCVGLMMYGLWFALLSWLLDVWCNVSLYDVWNVVCLVGLSCVGSMMYSVFYYGHVIDPVAFKSSLAVVYWTIYHPNIPPLTVTKTWNFQSRLLWLARHRVQ